MRTLKQYKFKYFEGLFFISPWIIGFLWFQLYPFIMSLYYSFTDYGLLRAPRFVGFTNYVRLLTNDRDFWLSLRVTGLYAFMLVPMKLCMALLVAVILNMKRKGVDFFRTVYYLPSIMGGSVAISVLWKLMFMRDGVINKLIGLSVDWIGSPKYALFTVSMLSVWQFGSSMVIFLAALQQIPSSLYEAAKVDGARAPTSFFRITLPMITPVLFFNLIMQTINALQEFTSAFVITAGGPLKSTFVLGIKLYQEAFTYYKMGYASALSWIMFIIIVVLTSLIFRSSSGWVYYEDGGDSV